MSQRHPLHCIIPPYMAEYMAKSVDPALREAALAHLASGSMYRTQRTSAQALPSLMALPSPESGKHRLVYDASNSDILPGKLVRSEGQPATKDLAINEAYDYSGTTYDFYSKLFQRNSLDGHGMTLISTVHVGEADTNGLYQPMNNAFWNGEQMAYGDGDNVLFRRFTKSLDVVAHELTHGVQSFTSNLKYRGEPGALNEHFADVFGVMVRQWKGGEVASTASWLVGAAVLVPAKTRRAIRDMEFPGTAYVNDPQLGTDPQPAAYAKLYKGASDSGGVHLNSGIPNRAFALAAKSIGGKAWESTGKIWYDAMLRLRPTATFADCARTTLDVAAKSGAVAKKAVKDAWAKVGISL